MKVGQCITITTRPLGATSDALIGSDAIIVETTLDYAVVATKFHGTWIFQTLPVERPTSRTRTRPNCFACADSGVILTSRTGSDNTDVSLHVDPCDSCGAYKGVSADIFGSYYDSLPQPGEEALARLGVEP